MCPPGGDNLRPHPRGANSGHLETHPLLSRRYTFELPTTGGHMGPPLRSSRKCRLYLSTLTLFWQFAPVSLFVHQIRVVQLRCEICPDGIQINPPQPVPLCHFLLRQALSFGLFANSLIRAIMSSIIIPVLPYTNFSISTDSRPFRVCPFSPARRIFPIPRREITAPAST